MNEETYYRLALSTILSLGPINARRMLACAGSATELFKERQRIREMMPEAHERLISLFTENADAALRKAESEEKFIEEKSIRVLTEEEDYYPYRMRGCDDAPIVLFFLGDADLNPKRVVNVVGTRGCTEYGKQMCDRILKELAELCPGTLVMSGLAYGVDIHAHRAALKYGLPTVAGLAHGLDRIYPAHHRSTAVEMLRHGGLITEFPSGTQPFPGNFLSRNRIIAGMSDATIVIESAKKGGSLVTADIANSYNRDVFAVPGRCIDPYSEGCNQLIMDNKAILMRSAKDLTEFLRWSTTKDKKKADAEPSFFPELTPDEEKVLKLLKEIPDGLPMGMLTVQSGISVGSLSAILISLEIKGLVKAMKGGAYRCV
jgi:DNA processing protein